ncbi:cytochrome b5-like [Fopius arisanus]|uniref:Cytochrome b5-like n=1 Tax=Fopius arisanus TaxID=64838 RepID=A0A9R1SX02_9HYME|nr:PREDICTED: cytochrome b5-like [Fopius arisanus]
MSHTVYTIEEVACHNGKSDTGLWIVIKDIVYDVTEYIHEHPGGEELLLEYAGRDATSAFNDFGHSSDAIAHLKLYKIGQLAEGDKRSKEIRERKRKSRRIFFPLFRSCST